MSTVKPALVISPQTQRRFILGRQGLYPGRRWRGQEGVVQAIGTDCVVQFDPLNVAARSHDIALYGRVLDYQPRQLDAVLYQERAAFEYGGAVVVYPMEELPFLRLAMSRRVDEPRWSKWEAEHPEAIQTVYEAIRRDGPRSARDFSGKTIQQQGSYRSKKDTGLALYRLWLTGELMTHSRRGVEKAFDLRERIAPAHLSHAAPLEEAETYLGLKVIRQEGMLSARRWRAGFAGIIERRVDTKEAEERLRGLLHDGAIVPVALEGDQKTPRYVVAEDFPLLETLHEGKNPNSWQPLETTTEEEMVLLAPLEVTTARGRALPLFGFEYVWEVYKPAKERRWGYYTLPILYGDRLVARLDPRLERATKTLHILGFWLEPEVEVDARFKLALNAGLRRFMRFIEAMNVQSQSELSQIIDFCRI